MSSINVKNGKLFFDFRFQRKRCREYTTLLDTSSNRKRMQQVLDKMEAEITLGSFEYERYFPGSKLAKTFVSNSAATTTDDSHNTSAPLFRDFSATWVDEHRILWRDSHLETVMSTIDKHLNPHFGDMSVAAITKADILKMRSTLADVPGRSGKERLAASTINRIMQINHQIMDEAAERFGFKNPAEKIKRVRQPKIDIHPFSLDEVQLMLSRIRPDFHDYLLVRFFTGLRTGELHGLQWKYVDFERRQILIRETWVRRKLTYTKTDGSQREVSMNQPVFEALLRQKKVTGSRSPFVFCGREGEPMDANNMTNRVWNPLLRLLGLEKRRPYQTRHTAATLWLASGENPEWVAKQLGHSSTQMLFNVYSRFIPNLTRADGSAMDRLLASRLSLPASQHAFAHSSH